MTTSRFEFEVVAGRAEPTAWVMGSTLRRMSMRTCLPQLQTRGIYSLCLPLTIHPKDKASLCPLDT